MRIGRVLFVIFVAVVLLIIFGDRGLMDYRAVREKHATLEEANMRLAVENDDLKREIGLLKTDERSIEAVARRELGMVKPGDRVYQFAD